MVAPIKVMSPLITTLALSLILPLSMLMWEVESALVSSSSGGRNSRTPPGTSAGGGQRGLRGLDKVLNRLNAAKDHPAPATTTNSATILDSIFQKSRNNANATATTYSAKRQQEFDDLEDEDLDEDDDSYEEDEDDDFGGNDVVADKKMNHHWGLNYKNWYLASKTTTTTTTSTTTTPTTTTTTTTTPPPPPPPISYSQYKWNAYGTRHAVDQSRRQSHYQNGGFYNGGYSRGHNSNNGHSHSRVSSSSGGYPGSQPSKAQAKTPDTAIKEAVNHALKVSKDGACRIPKPKVVRVQDHYPHPGKTYLPHCTILHQCSDDTGCCKNGLSCSPKSTQRVELSFYTITVDSNRGSTVERLVFYNHTECECRDKMDELMPRDGSGGQQGRGGGEEDPGNNNNNSYVDQQLTSHSSYDQTRNPNKNAVKCRCPSLFTQRILADGSCACDCFDKQTECLRQKRGHDFFSMQDKWCIQSGRCEIPGCTYGSYIHLAGRCPRKKEKYSLSWHRYLTEFD